MTVLEEELYTFVYYSLQAGRLQQAVDACRSLIFIAPSQPLYWLSLAEGLFQQKKYKDAAHAAQTAKKIIDTVALFSEPKSAIQSWNMIYSSLMDNLLLYGHFVDDTIKLD